MLTASEEGERAAGDAGVSPAGATAKWAGGGQALLLEQDRGHGPKKVTSHVLVVTQLCTGDIPVSRSMCCFFGARLSRVSQWHPGQHRCSDH